MFESCIHPGGGLHYGTALVACGLVTGNSWNGYFTLDRNCPRLALSDDEVLLGKTYYFHIPSSTPNPFDYAVTPSFEHWSFPHDNLPPTWSSCAADALRDRDDVELAPPSASNLTAAVLSRDGSCRVTTDKEYVERAHLCPRSQAAWFEANGMDQYNLNESLHGECVVDDV